MKTLAIEINDAGLRGRDESGELFDSPGYALADGSIVVGTKAMQQARLQPGRVYDSFWGDLSLESLPDSARSAATVADLAFHHLNQVWSDLAEKADSVIFAVPGSFTREQLSLLLGIARECGMPVGGLVDAAVVAAEHPAPGRQLMHLELMSRRTVLTELTQGRRLRRTRVTTLDDVGLAGINDVFANVVADGFVRNTRYDPMHSADSEQAVYDRLPGWIEEIYQQGRAQLSLESNGRQHEVAVTGQSLADAVQSTYRKMTRHIAASSRPGEPLTLLLSDRMQTFPGLREALAESLPQADIVELGAGAAALGALRRADEVLSGGEAVSFVTSVRWNRESQPISLPADPAPGRSDLPTHVLYRGRAWPIGQHPLHLGSQAHDHGLSIVLTGETSGVSRDHCLILNRDGAVVVEDRSRHGTYLNGQRVDGAAQARYGDVLRLGGADQVVQLIVVPAEAGSGGT